MSSSALSTLEFMLICYNLKAQKRTGWVRSKVSDAESIADHMHFCALLALLIDDRIQRENSDKPIDRDRCVKIALVHDLAEAVVGDLLPGELDKQEKHRRENEAMMSFRDQLNSPCGDEIYSLWMEYETASSPEARIVKQLDKLEMMIQAYVYEKEQGLDLSSFFGESSTSVITDPQLLGILEALLHKRKQLKEKRSVAEASNN